MSSVNAPTITANVTDTEESLLSWVSVIFYPNRIPSPNYIGNEYESAQSVVRNRPRISQDFQFLDQVGEVTMIKAYSFHPGTNIGHHDLTVNDDLSISKIPFSDIEKIVINVRNRSLFDTAFEIIQPISEDSSEPGYRNFDEDNAIKLIRNHFHASWINRALQGEKRTKVANEADRRIKWLIAEERKLQEMS